MTITSPMRGCETLKVREIPAGYDPSQYVTERLMVPARDGVHGPGLDRLPQGFRKRTAPAFCMSMAMAPTALPIRRASRPIAFSLLDRGFAFAIAHIRGGDDLGYRWFLDGKLDKRCNTFNDFVDVTRVLIDQGYAKAGSGHRGRADRPAVN